MWPKIGHANFPVFSNDQTILGQNGPFARGVYEGRREAVGLMEGRCAAA
jgi:hypothetical protein